VVTVKLVAGMEHEWGSEVQHACSERLVDHMHDIQHAFEMVCNEQQRAGW
jgi:hypothetical protein